MGPSRQCALCQKWPGETVSCPPWALGLADDEAPARRCKHGACAKQHKDTSQERSQSGQASPLPLSLSLSLPPSFSESLHETIAYLPFLACASPSPSPSLSPSGESD